MAEPVRLRGEVGERRVAWPQFRAASLTGNLREFAENEFAQWRPDQRAADRRGLAMLTPGNVAARVDAIVAHFKAALAELQEQSRADRAEVAKLTLQLNEHMDEVASLTGTVEHLRAENERLREADAKAAIVIERNDAYLIRYAAAGEVAGE